MKINFILIASLILIFNACSGGGGSGNDDMPESNDEQLSEKVNTNEINKIIKKTNQIASYAENGQIVTDSSLKDDAYYKKGVRARYTKSSDIVTDEVTSLMWHDDIGAKSMTRSFKIATSYCSNSTIGGYTDWRIPEITELQSIVSYGKQAPSLDTKYFKFYEKHHYWSSTAYIKHSSSDVWTIDFNEGTSINKEMLDKHYVRCVRNRYN